MNFNSHASCEAWPLLWQFSENSTVISTHTPHARRDLRVLLGSEDIDISTHTPHARRDLSTTQFYLRQLISTHTPHARRDREIHQRTGVPGIFQLTRLMRGVTESWLYRSSDKWFQLTRLMRGVTNQNGTRQTMTKSFQLTRLMRGVTTLLKVSVLQFGNFNSHASCEAWRPCQRSAFYSLGISTHTPHARRDFGFDFLKFINCKFQLTRLMRGVTYSWGKFLSHRHFNSHASCEAWRH